jgi:hypothetical protein
MTDVREATHVKVNGQWEKIASKYGIDAEGHLAKPSCGGFGVITESGVQVSMWEAEAYKQELHDSEKIDEAIRNACRNFRGDQKDARQNIITQHLKNSEEMMEWLEIMMAFSAATTGLPEAVKEQAMLMSAVSIGLEIGYELAQLEKGAS